MKPEQGHLERALLARKGRRSGDEITFCCPAPGHSDEHPSAAFNVEKGAGMCHGCGAKWSERKLRNLLDLGSLERKTGRRPEVAYDYCDERGQLLYQVVRLTPGPNGKAKGFFQRRPDGHGGMINNLKGVRRVLYRLPELLAADPRALVFVVEGEKDVDRLRSLGLVATCNVGGAGKWRPSDGQFLKGRDVIVIPDNDEAGRKHADRVIDGLRGVAETVRRLELPGVREKGDVSDWLDDGHSPEELVELTEQSRALVLFAPTAPVVGSWNVTTRPAPSGGVRVATA